MGIGPHQEFARFCKLKLERSIEIQTISNVRMPQSRQKNPSHHQIELTLEKSGPLYFVIRIETNQKPGHCQWLLGYRLEEMRLNA